MNNLRIYVGWDPREEDGYSVTTSSFHRHTTIPIEVIPLKLKDLPQLTRPIERRGTQLWCPISDAPMATEFAISRFVIPQIQNEGWALFVDSDVLCLADVKELMDLADPKYAVMVVKHAQKSTGSTVKMDGQLQTFYNRKNWSSVVLWNCGHPSNRKLTLEDLNTRPGRDLHAFYWLEDGEIGELPLGWNYLVDVSPPCEDKKILHYTLGIPSMPGYENCSFADLWKAELSSNWVA